MGRLSKVQRKSHDLAMQLVESDRQLSYDEIELVLDTYHPSVHTHQGMSGAFFTPCELAREFAVETQGLRENARVLDLCAGIGSLSYWCEHINEKIDLVCVELSADFCRIGKRLLPEATWIHSSVFDPTLADHTAVQGRFDLFISNPPFGKIPKSSDYKGKASCLEYAVAEVGMQYANQGVMIVPQSVLPWKFSGQRGYTEVDNKNYDKWSNSSQLVLGANCGIDVSMMPFTDVSVAVEITCVHRVGDD